MAQTLRFESFYQDKQSFFREVRTLDAAEVRAQNVEQNFAFLSKNRLYIEQEFNQMFSSLKKNGQDRDEFWLYCYYCSLMLHSYYSTYGKKAQASKYAQLRRVLAYRVEEGRLPQDDERIF